MIEVRPELASLESHLTHAVMAARTAHPELPGVWGAIVDVTHYEGGTAPLVRFGPAQDPDRSSRDPGAGQGTA